MRTKVLRRVVIMIVVIIENCLFLEEDGGVFDIPASNDPDGYKSTLNGWPGVEKVLRTMRECLCTI